MFTDDVSQTAGKVAKKIPNGSFISFAVDGIGLESVDVMTSICNLLAGNINYTGAVDDRHNIKNDIYALIGVFSAPTIGTLFIDTDILRHAKTPTPNFRVVDFASDKRSETLLSYETLKMVVDTLQEGQATDHVQDSGALACVFSFMRLHLHAVNGRFVPAKHRALFVWMSMICGHPSLVST